MLYRHVNVLKNESLSLFLGFSTHGKLAVNPYLEGTPTNVDD